MAKRQFAGGVILCLALNGPLIAETPTAVLIGTPPQPSWSQLDERQKNILSPLAANWDEMENIRRRKWLGIAERYPNLTPTEQGRVQVRMRDWAALTPQQRARIRNTYRDFRQLPAEQKEAVKQKWEAYSNLSPEEKQRIRSSGKSAKLLTPPESIQPVTAPENTPPPPPETSRETGKR